MYETINTNNFISCIPYYVYKYLECFVLNSNIIDIVQVVLTDRTRKHPANVMLMYIYDTQ